MQMFGAQRDKDTKRGSFGKITHGSALSSDKYGGQLTSASSPEHDADTGYKSAPNQLPVIGLEVADSGLYTTHTWDVLKCLSV